MARMKTRLAIALLGLAPALAFPADDGIRAFRVTLSPEKFHEECMRLEKGEVRRFQFRAGAKVAFNIHYHRDMEVFYPVKDDATKRKSGRFRAPAADEYCWMWTARQPTNLEGRIQR